MNNTFEDFISSVFGGAEVCSVEDQEKEAHRLYLAAKVEMFDERLKFIKEMIDLCIKDDLHKISPWMMGFMEGTLRVYAMISNTKFPLLKRPPFWYNDPATERRIRMSHRYRQKIRRKVTRLVWDMIYAHHKFHITASNIPQYKIEKMARGMIMEVLEGIPASWKFRKYLRDGIKATGVDYEKIRDAESLEGRWPQL